MQSMTTARNVLIILAIAAAVAFVPGGTTTGGVVNAILTSLILLSFVAFAARLYIERRIEIFSLGDRDRTLMYAALGALVLAFAGRLQWIATTAGTVVFVVLLCGAAGAMYGVFLRWRAYR